MVLKGIQTSSFCWIKMLFEQQSESNDAPKEFARYCSSWKQHNGNNKCEVHDFNSNKIIGSI